VTKEVRTDRYRDNMSSSKSAECGVNVDMNFNLANSCRTNRNADLSSKFSIHHYIHLQKLNLVLAEYSSLCRAQWLLFAIPVGWSPNDACPPNSNSKRHSNG